MPQFTNWLAGGTDGKTGAAASQTENRPVTLSNSHATLGPGPSGWGGMKPLWPLPKSTAPTGMLLLRAAGDREGPAAPGVPTEAASPGATPAIRLARRTLWVMPLRSAQETSTTTVLAPPATSSVTMPLSV